MASKIHYVKGGFQFYCPGCDFLHTVDTIEGQSPYWSFDGKDESPTISPSYLLAIPARADGRYPALRCHSYIRAGRIEYLSDSLHHLSGQTVEMIDWDEWENGTLI